MRQSAFLTVLQREFDMGSCYIIAANLSGRVDIQMSSDDLLIAVDGGYRTALDSGIEPDIVLGDFDSLGFVPRGENVIVLPVKKDDTDTLAAVKRGLELGYKVFYIYGGMGGRTDHTLANVQTLMFIAQNGGRGFLVSQDECITVINNTSVYFSETASGTVSVFAVGGDAEGVSICGLLYELENEILKPCFPVGVSNSFLGKRAQISVENGSLLITFGSKDFILY